MSNYQTITRHLVSDNTNAFNKNLYKVPFFNIYFLKAIKTENNLKFTLPNTNNYVSKSYGFKQIVDIPKTLWKKLEKNNKRYVNDNSRIEKA